jgi:glutaredoxin
LQEKSLNYEEIELGTNGLSYSSLAAITGEGTTPQIYIDGNHVGGADELERYLNM